MSDDIGILLHDIDRLHDEMRFYSTMCQKQKYEMLLRFVFLALTWLFYVSKGWIRVQKMHPSGHDLLFLIYVSHIAQSWKN